jgi:hypothetical protein
MRLFPEFSMTKYSEVDRAYLMACILGIFDVPTRVPNQIGRN